MANIMKGHSYQELSSLRNSYNEETSYRRREVYKGENKDRKNYNDARGNRELSGRRNIRSSRDLSACRNIHSYNELTLSKEVRNNQVKRSASQCREKRRSYNDLKGSQELMCSFSNLKGSRELLGSFPTLKGSQELLGSFTNLRNLKVSERRSFQDVTNLVDLGSATDLSHFMEKGSCEELAAENWKIKMFLESTEVNTKLMNPFWLTRDEALG